MTLSDKIQLCRKKKGMSQEDLANLLDVSRQAVQKWESGASVPELDKIISMSNIFSVSLDWLIKDVNEAKQNNEQTNVTMVLDFSEIRHLKRNEIALLFNDFKKLKYNPKDKRAAKKEAKNTKINLSKLLSEDEMNSLIAQYRAYLSSFSLDEDYYIKRKKRLIKFSIICASALVLTGICVGSGFGIAKAVSYNNANALLESGNYKSALLAYEELGDSQKVNVCSGLLDLESSKNANDDLLIKSGIRKIISGGETVGVGYQSKNSKGKMSLNQEYEYEETISSSDFVFYQPSQIDGYTFSNWRTFDFNYKNNQTHLNLYPVWNTISYSISYELYGGVNSNKNPTSYTLESGELDLYSPEKTGYSFFGWFLDASFSSQPVEKIPLELCKDIVLYAKWQPNAYLINFSLNGGEMDSPTSISVTFDHNVTLPIPSRIGYTFSGWYYDNQKINNGIWKIPNDVTLSAHWSGKTYTVTPSVPTTNGTYVVYYHTGYETVQK